MAGDRIWEYRVQESIPVVGFMQDGKFRAYVATHAVSDALIAVSYFQEWETDRERLTAVTRERDELRALVEAHRHHCDHEDDLAIWFAANPSKETT